MSNQSSAPVKPNPYGVAPLNLSQTMQERRSKRRVDAKVYGAMPDYSKEPAQWEVRMTKRIKGLAGSFGYSVYASGEIVKATWDRAKERGWMGDTGKVLLVAKGVIARRERAKRQPSAEAKALPTDPKRPTEPLAVTIERLLREKYKAQNPQVVRRIMKEARVSEAFRRDEDILTDLCAVAETTFFKPAADHWMSKPGEARNFYRYLHILASDVPLMERIQRANIALGNVYSPCNYAGSLGEAKDAIEAEFKPKTPVLDETFKREDEAEPVEDESVATPAQTTEKKNWADIPVKLGKFWGKVNGQLNEYPAWRKLGKEGQEAFVHETIGGKLHETELELDECADFVIDAGREAYGVDEPKAKAEKPANDWSQDTNKVMALIEKLKPIAARMDIAEDHIVNEACHALKIGAWSEFVGTGKEFYDDLCAIWKSVDSPAQNTKQEPSAKKDAPAGNSEPQSASIGAKATSLKLIPIIAAFTTLTGISIGDLQAELDKPYAKKAYKEITLDGGRKGTDIAQAYVRDRFDAVFGPQGIGWKFELSSVGRVECSEFKEKENTKFRVTMVAHIFKYRVASPDGTLEWMELSPMSDTGENRKQGYAYRSAFTSLLKQVLRSFGGFNHLKAA